MNKLYYGDNVHASIACSYLPYQFSCTPKKQKFLKSRVKSDIHEHRALKVQIKADREQSSKQSNCWLHMAA